MNRDRLVSLFVVLASITVGTIVVWLVFFRPERVVERPQPTVLVAPPKTPLRDSIRESKASKKQRVKGEAPGSARQAPRLPGRYRPSTGLVQKSPTRTGARKGRSPKRKPKATTGPNRPGGEAQQPSQQPQPSSPPKPEPGITVPLPSVCVPPVPPVNC